MSDGWEKEFPRCARILCESVGDSIGVGSGNVTVAFEDMAEIHRAIQALMAARRLERDALPPIPMLLVCPNRDCGKRHVDSGKFATTPHRTHACQHCGHVWQPAIANTVGVLFLPGYGP